VDKLNHISVQYDLTTLHYNGVLCLFVYQNILSISLDDVHDNVVFLRRQMQQTLVQSDYCHQQFYVVYLSVVERQIPYDLQAQQFYVYENNCEQCDQPCCK